MARPLTDQVMQKAQQATKLHHRLVFVVAPTGVGKTTALHDMQSRTDAPLINVSLEVSRRMLELTGRQRALRLPNILQEIVGNNEVVLLDNIEIIFDVVLMCDPLRLLLDISRNMIVVAAWNGTIVESSLTYAAPDHPEYRRYPIRDFLVVEPEMAT